MIALLLALLAGTPAPGQLQVSTPQGTRRIDLVRWKGEGPLVPLDPLARALAGSISAEGDWAVLESPSGRFRFLAGSPLVHDGTTLLALPAGTHRRGDSLWVPLAFVSQILADPARKAWSWTPATGVLLQRSASVTTAAAAAKKSNKTESRGLLPSGLKPGHHVTIDAGHGGTDPGNPGLFFPRGMREKDVTLAVALKVRAELERHGVIVTMTRTTDTLINLGQRAPRYCRAECDLFVSIHVNSLDKRPGYTNVRGFETYFLGEARTADAARVARVENEAIRYNTESDEVDLSELGFMLKDLQTNEFLRASARAAEYMQTGLVAVESGPNKGVKSAGFAVLTTARRPSILVEIGYATNPADARMMTTPDGQAELATAIAGAIVNYLKYDDRITSDTAGSEH
jgi:N-acetylmuramoyl-L-alanine amidase